MSFPPRFDCHLHTCYSPCGTDEMTVENILARASELNLRGICLTDHLHSDTPIEQFHKLREEVKEANTFGIDVRVGCEVNVLAENKWSISEGQVDEFDIILAAPIHLIEGVEKPVNFDNDSLAEYWLMMLQSAINCPGANIIVHPVVLPTGDDFGLNQGKIIQKCLNDGSLRPILEQAAEKSIAFELNPKPANIKELAYKPVQDFYRLCMEYKVKISLGSDAHALDGVRSGMDVWDFHKKFLAEINLSSEGQLYVP